MQSKNRPFKVGDYVKKKVGRNKGETGIIRRIAHDPFAGKSAEVCFMAGYSQWNECSDLCHKYTGGQR